jgi:hypothetical protein
MGSSCSPKQDALTVGSDANSSFSFIERGLNCLQQGRHVEGSAFFVLARERLCASQEVQLAATLDTLNKAIASHLLAQQSLHEASKLFAETETEQHALIEELKKLLSTTVEVTLPESSTGTKLRKTPRENQMLRLIPHPTEIVEQFEQHQTSSLEIRNTLPALYITCFGHFEVRRFDPSSSPFDLCTNLKEIGRAHV